jgi:hypothetical protein
VLTPVNEALTAMIKTITEKERLASASCGSTERWSRRSRLIVPQPGHAAEQQLDFDGAAQHEGQRDSPQSLAGCAGFGD